VFEPVSKDPWQFADGTFMQAFQHDDINLTIFHDGNEVRAFGFIWPARNPPVEGTSVSWHRDCGFRTERVVPILGGELGHTEPQEFNDFPRLIELVETAGASLPHDFRYQIRDALTNRI
jgi:hypothetical protein